MPLAGWYGALLADYGVGPDVGVDVGKPQAEQVSRLVSLR